MSLERRGSFEAPYCSLAQRGTVDLERLRTRASWSLEEYAALRADVVGMEAHFRAWYERPTCATLFARFDDLFDPAGFAKVQRWLGYGGVPLHMRPRASSTRRAELPPQTVAALEATFAGLNALLEALPPGNLTVRYPRGSATLAASYQ